MDGETFLGDKRENVVGRPELNFTMNKIPTQFETLKPKNWLPSFVTKSSAKLTRPLTSSYVVIHPYRISSWLNHHFVCNNVDNWQLLNEFSRCTPQIHTIFPRRFLFFRYRWEGFVTVVSASQPSSMPIVNFFELHKLCHQQLQICILSWVQRQLFLC